MNLVRKNLYLFALLLCSSLAGAASSDTTVGNGGDLVTEDGGYHFFLLDLYETGVHTNPYFDQNQPTDAEILSRVQNAFPLDSTVHESLARKISEVAAFDKMLGFGLLKALEMLNWKQVDYPLVNVPDEGTVYRGQLYQGAIRQGMSVFFRAEHWGKLDDSNRVALLMHELIYALYHPEEFGNGQHVQRSHRVREINSLFFTKDWNKNPTKAYAVIDAALPTDGGTGFLELPSGNEFAISPILAASSYTVGSPYALRAKPAYGLNEPQLIDDFCNMYSSEEYRSGVFHNNYVSLALRIVHATVEFRRARYTSPFGLLDYIKWKETPEKATRFFDSQATELPPYGKEVVKFLNLPRMVSTVLGTQRIIEEGDRPEKIKLACEAFVHDQLFKHGAVLDNYK